MSDIISKEKMQESRKEGTSGKHTRCTAEVEMRRVNFIHTLILFAAAFIWGTAFVSQAVGADIVDAYTFQASRNWFSFGFLVLTVIIADKISVKRTGISPAPKTKEEKKTLFTGGLVCGTLLFFATITQQIGIAYTTTAKSGFITAMYVVIVPVISIFLGKAPKIKIWICVGLGVIGLYLLSITGNEGIGFGDLMTLICAFVFSFQILAVSHYVVKVDPIRLSRNQFFVSAVLSTICMFTIGNPSLAGISEALPSIMYAGILSGGIAYTLQIVGQRGVNPTIASLTMSLESVFGALAGWVVLGQTLTGREFAGCAIMFAAIVISQI